MNVVDRSPDELWVCHLGVVAYRDALALQEQIRARRQADELPDTLLLLEHPPTYTRGRRSGSEDLQLGESLYRAKDIDVIDVDRGGKVTYHGPGQLVGYPIMRIDDVHRHLRTIEDTIIDALAGTSVYARSRRDEGIDYTGVWVKDRKIASIGVHVSRGVTTHGFAVNVDNDLEPFSWVIACGLPDVAMTSLARELVTWETSAAATEKGATALDGCRPSPDRSSLACMRKRIAHAFCQAHGRRQRLVSPARLGIDTANAPQRAERAPIKTLPFPQVEPVLA